MDPILEHRILSTRRDVLLGGARGLGGIALGSLLADDGVQAAKFKSQRGPESTHGVLGDTHFPAKAKRVIFLYATGGVSHIESFDYKPKLIGSLGKTITVRSIEDTIAFYRRVLDCEILWEELWRAGPASGRGTRRSSPWSWGGGRSPRPRRCPSRG